VQQQLHDDLAVEDMNPRTSGRSP